MSDIRLSVDKISWSRLAPQKLPDLFRGSRLVVAGRYTGEGATAIHLKGRVGNREESFVFDAHFPEEAGRHDFVATIWAQRRIAQLLDAIRLNGSSQELIAEVTRLGTEHGIVTPYTSQLIVEEGERIAHSRGREYRGPGDMIPGGRGGGPATRGRLRDVAQKAKANKNSKIEMKKLNEDLRRAGVQLDAGVGALGSDDFVLGRGTRQDAKGGGSMSGILAVLKSRETARLRYLQQLDGKARGRLFTSQRVKDRTFHFVAGVWIDSRFKKAMQKKIQKIEAFSTKYFELLAKRPELAGYLAFSTSIVIVTGNDTAIEITPQKKKAGLEQEAVKKG